LGATQLGFSGGEPLVRKDLIEIVAYARKLGFYTNLITSAIGLNEEKLAGLKEAGLDNIQISFQAQEKNLNDLISGKESFDKKIAMIKLVKQYGYPLTLNVVIHRMNIDHIQQIMDMCLELKADYVELANTQYYGFAKVNQALLIPSESQLKKAEAITHEYQQRYKDIIKFYYVISDYYENRPKACMNGWGTTFLCITPDGYALPCQMARVLPNLVFPKVTEHTLEWIWNESELFQKYRGYEWMEEPCRSCPERFKDFGGCRCQAFLLTGDAQATDPVCDLSPKHEIVVNLRKKTDGNDTKEHTLIYRSPKNTTKYSKP
jgi:pyrroloquinoline quinone biosynthesis protein E